MSNMGSDLTVYKIRKECFYSPEKIRHFLDPRHFTLDPEHFTLDPRHSTFDPRPLPVKAVVWKYSLTERLRPGSNVRNHRCPKLKLRVCYVNCLSHKRVGVALHTSDRWDLWIRNKILRSKTLNIILFLLFLYNKGDLPLMYCCVFGCEFIDLVGVFWLFLCDPVTKQTVRNNEPVFII